MLLVGQCRLGLQPLRDILHRSDDPCRLALAVKEHFAQAVDVAHLAIGPTDPVLQVEKQFAAQGALHCLLDPAAVIGVHTSDKNCKSGWYRSRAQPPQPEVFVRPIQHA